LVDDLGARQLPATSADVRRGRDAAARIVRASGGDEPELGVLLPVPVRRHLREAAEVRLAFVQSLLCALALGDVLAYSAVAAETTLGVQHRQAGDAHPAYLPGVVRPLVFKVVERQM